MGLVNILLQECRKRNILVSPTVLIYAIHMYNFNCFQLFIDHGICPNEMSAAHNNASTLKHLVMAINHSQLLDNQIINIVQQNPNMAFDNPNEAINALCLAICTTYNERATVLLINSLMSSRHRTTAMEYFA